VLDQGQASESVSHSLFRMRRSNGAAGRSARVDTDEAEFVAAWCSGSVPEGGFRVSGAGSGRSSGRDA
jgi:hypothetical protein